MGVVPSYEHHQLHIPLSRVYRDCTLFSCPFSFSPFVLSDDTTPLVTGGGGGGPVVGTVPVGYPVVSLRVHNDVDEHGGIASRESHATVQYSRLLKARGEQAFLVLGFAVRAVQCIVARDPRHWATSGSSVSKIN